jgi:thiol-disulfide isomerase/thioredoxin
VAWRTRGVFACAALLLAGLIACSERKPQSFQPRKVFPPVPLVSLTGGRSVLPEALRGRAVVINFWATWCEPCRKEMPSLERLHRQINPAKLLVIGVSVDSDLNLAREFLHQYALTFPNYTDSAQKLARDSLKIQAFPVTFLVAADGTVRARITGARDWASADALDLLERTLDVSIGAK